MITKIIKSLSTNNKSATEDFEIIWANIWKTYQNESVIILKRVENTMTKGEIVQKSSAAEVSESNAGKDRVITNIQQAKRFRVQGLSCGIFPERCKVLIQYKVLFFPVFIAQM